MFILAWGPIRKSFSVLAVGRGINQVVSVQWVLTWNPFTMKVSKTFGLLGLTDSQNFRKRQARERCYNVLLSLRPYSFTSLVKICLVGLEL